MFRIVRGGYVGRGRSMLEVEMPVTYRPSTERKIWRPFFHGVKRSIRHSIHIYIYASETFDFSRVRDPRGLFIIQPRAIKSMSPNLICHRHNIYRNPLYNMFRCLLCLRFYYQQRFFADNSRTSEWTIRF